jgi:cytochrome c oxidase subunit I
MSKASISQTLDRLPPRDRTLLKALAGGALLTLTIGIVLGLLTAMIRTGTMTAEPQAGYRDMTGHGVSVFFYWLYFAQIALLLGLAALENVSSPRIALRPVAWAGSIAMAAGFAGNMTGTWTGAPLLYDGSPDLAGDVLWPAGLFYGGYVLLALGLFLLAFSGIATMLAARRQAPEGAWSTIGFAVAAWAGLVMVSSVATLYTFLPAMAWAFGFGAEPTHHATGWHLLFHNLHYLPLMGTIIVWYALIEDMTGVGSIFGRRFSKTIFTLYLVFVPPTSLYHMFLEPDLSPILRGLGSLLSLFISVPTIGVFLVIVISMEARARAAGATGLFGWLKFQPWQEPAMMAIAMAVVNLALGGIFAFVLIQEKLAPLVSDTFFVPAYFHFLTIGTVTLTLLGAFSWYLPAMTGKALRGRALLRWLPVVMSAGIAVFGAAGMAAGLQGMPRRTLDVAYDGAAPHLWTAVSPFIAIGAAVMGLSLLLYVAAVGLSLFGPRRAGSQRETPVAAAPDIAIVLAQPSWTAPACIAVLIACMYGATAAAFALLHALPVAAVASVAH